MNDAIEGAAESWRLIAILVEVVIAGWLISGVFYRLRDVVCNAASFIGYVVVAQPLLRLGPFIAYAVVYEAVAIAPMAADAPLTWVFAVLGTDLAYYWWHRANHRTGLLWAVHVVHHSSSELNFTTNLRFSWFSGVSAWLFHLPLAIAGLPPEVALAAYLFHNDVWGFFSHTRLVRKLGWLEHILVTPSHHRVHHGGDEKYLDKNYGSLFIVWDKLFGTFQREEEEPRYGLAVPLEHDNPIRVNLDPWRELGSALWRATSLRGALAVLLGPPAQHPVTSPTVSEGEPES